MRLGRKADIESRKRIFEAIYNEGDMTVDETAEMAEVPKPTTYDTLTKYFPDMISSGNRHVAEGRWRKFYNIKKEYRAGINECLDGGIDIFDSINYAPKCTGKKKRPSADPTST